MSYRTCAYEDFPWLEVQDQVCTGRGGTRIRCSQPGRNAVLIPLKGHNLTRVEQRCQWDRVHQAAGTLVRSHHTVPTPLSSQCHGVFGGMVPWGPEGLLDSACFFILKN